MSNNQDHTSYCTEVLLKAFSDQIGIHEDDISLQIVKEILLFSEGYFMKCGCCDTTISIDHETKSLYKLFEQNNGNV